MADNTQTTLESVDSDSALRELKGEVGPLIGNGKESIMDESSSPQEQNPSNDIKPQLTSIISEDNFKAPISIPLSLSSSLPSKTTKKSHENKSTPISKADPSCDRETSSKTPSSQQKGLQPPVIYSPPSWSGIAEQTYSFEVLKNGTIINNIPLNGAPYFVFGRLQSCDVTLEHPSLSRYHAVVQYCKSGTPLHENGWYIYDLDSTHGTWVNKKRLTPKVYHRLKVGYVVKFGGSSRLHILQGPSTDEDEESELSVTELKEQKQKMLKQVELLRQAEQQEKQRRREAEEKFLQDRGCSWGMGEDAEDDGDENPNADSSRKDALFPENESLYIDDPKKALKGFYEREGCDLPDYQFTEVSIGKHKCILELPVDGPNGEELVAEAVVSGKKKEAVVACALEACRILDRLGMLRASKHESRKRKKKNWEEDDFYDSDDDTFLDRTGTIEKKRTMRMKQAGKAEAETYDSLLSKHTQVSARIKEIELKLEKAKAEAEAMALEEMDELDAYMVSIKSGAMDTKTKMQLKGELLRLKMEEQKLRSLVNIAKPASLPPLQPRTHASQQVSDSVNTVTASLSKKLLDVQHRQQRRLEAVKKVTKSAELKPDDYQEEDDEDDDNDNEETEFSRKSKDSVNQSASSKASIPSDSLASRLRNDSDQDLDLPSSKADPTKKPSPSPKEKVREKKGKNPHQFSTADALNNLERTKLSSSGSGSHQLDPNYDPSDPDFAVWLPPAEQSGDGRTSLNDKLGY